MATLSYYTGSLARMFRTDSKPLKNPEPLPRKGRAMTGLLSQLPPEQRQAVLSFRGCENFGPDEPRRKPHKNG